MCDLNKIIKNGVKVNSRRFNPVLKTGVAMVGF